MENVDLFSVLKSPTRRAILKTLMKREMHISGIAREFRISVAQASKHCKMLESRGILSKKTFGRTQVLRAQPDALYGLMDFFSDESVIEVDRGASIIDALTQVAGVKVERADARGFVTSIDGEEGYFIYEVNGSLPNVSMDNYRLEEDSTVELKKILHVKKKRMDVRIKKVDD